MSHADNDGLSRVDNHGGMGEWAFAQIEDPWDCVKEIRGAIEAGLP